MTGVTVDTTTSGPLAVPGSDLLSGALLAEMLPDAVLLVEAATGRLLRWNPAALRVFGYGPDEMTRLRLPDLVPTLGPVAPGSPPVTLEARRKDGTEVLVEPLLQGPAEGPGAAAFLCVLRDVTAVRQNEAALRASEARVRSILEHSTNLFYAHTPDHRLTYLSPQTRAFFDCDPDEALVHWPEFATSNPLNASGFARTEEALRTGKRQPPYLLELVGRKGRRVWAEVNEAPVVEDGKVVAMVGALTDVTAREEAAAARASAEAQAREIQRLKELDEFKSQFMNMAAHEINTPLTPIKLQVHLLKNTGDLTPAQRRSVETLERNVIRLSGLVQDVLDSAKLQMRRFPITKRPLDLNEVLTEAYQAFRAPAEHGRIQLQFTPGPLLPVQADALRLSQVLYNFLSNAVKFTPPGGAVRILAAVEDDKVVVRVVDSGRGLTREQMSRLFLPFSQAHDTMKETRGGTGLGLYISKAIVELHGGTAWCQSRGPDQGATFGFALPLDPNPPPDLGAKPRAAEATPRTWAADVAGRARHLI